MNAAVTPEISTTTTPIQAADRLGFTVFLAAAVHALLILGISFDLPDPNTLSKTLEVTLATLKSEKQPDKADYLAQINQEGSGTLDHKATPKTTEEAPFQDKEIRKVAPPKPAPQAATEPTPAKALTTLAPQPQRVAPQPAKPEPKPAQRPTPSFDSSMLSAEIASLEAQLSQERELYAKRPRVHRLNAASTMQDKGAWYKEDWRKKVERIGNLNYPSQARQQKIYGKLRMLVAINRDGTLREVSILESSGKDLLDQAALRIVRLAAPFAPFTGDLADVDVLEVIRTWRFESGDRLSSR
ncbi:energy transducer TonB [Atopomonas sediminilitoris]|uniref:energy transducer TonB n=1 Tax=Atopomonas sediminilitoris TaxID=2919919 RepID=UPI001F4EF29F|nr:energy transducer TonB [Atopomonas sediminilitoris]MCJ8168233.1 energy transducer TonB [Atopomonas sediminilitoris]